jgi:hypothetical protein
MTSEKVLDDNQKDNILTLLLPTFIPHIYILNRNESCKAIHDEFLL